MKRESGRDTDGCGGVSRRKARRKTDGLTWMWPSEIPHQYAVGRLPAPGPPGGAPANGGGRCWVAGRGHAPPEGRGCGRWPAGALPRWLPFLVKQVLKQATTCFRAALNCEGMRRHPLLSGERQDPPIYYGGLAERSVSRSRGVSGL
jgi:hypothetical protein